MTNAQVTRRRWLADAAVTTAATIVGAGTYLRARNAGADAPDTDQHRWIDAHSHIWSHDVEKYPLANGYTAKNLSPVFTDKELLAVAHPAGVGRPHPGPHRFPLRRRPRVAASQDGGARVLFCRQLTCR